jgi:sarcosine oxidase subunit gamma
MPGPKLREHLTPRAKVQGLAVVDLSQAFAVLKVNGPRTRDVLMKGCSLDLDPNSFPVGCCTRTRFGQLHITLYCADATPLFELYVGRSHVAYLESWLKDAALEFQ